MQVSQVFLPLKEPLVATLGETCALTSGANDHSELSETFRLLWSHSTVFTLEKKSQKC